MQTTAVLTSADEGGFVATDPETGTTSQGDTVERAVANLLEAVELYLEIFPMKVASNPRVTSFDKFDHA